MHKRQYYLKANAINRDDLIKAFNNDTLLLNIPQFISKSVCQYLTNQIYSKLTMGYYANAPKIGRIGKAFYETIDDAKARQQYFAKSQHWVHQLRQACLPYISPIDLLRVTLDGLWHKGANIATVNDQKMFVGLVRFYSAMASAEPHQDIIQRDEPNYDISHLIQKQISFNLYLQLPKRGGDLEFWDWQPSDDEFLQKRDSRPELAYAFDREQIPHSDFQFKLHVGDCVFFNTKNVHAVTPSHGDRLSISCFIGFCGYDKPLVLWS